MLVDLLEKSKSYFRNTLFQKAAIFLDEKNDSLRQKSNLILPTLIGAIIQKCDSDIDVVDDLYNKIKYSNFNAISNFEEIFKGGNSLVFEESYSFHKNIFGNKSRDVINVLHKESALDKESIFSLIKMIIPIVIKTIGNQINKDKLNLTDFIELINSQKQNIARSVTADFMYKMINDLDLYSIDYQYESDNFIKQNNDNTSKNGNLKLIIKALSIFAVLALIAATFFFLKNKNKLVIAPVKFKNEQSTDVDSLKIVVNTIDNTTILYNNISKDFSGKYVKGYEFLGALKEITLKDSTKLIVFSDGGFSKLIDHIEKDKPISKQAWYNFYGIAVQKNTADIDIQKSKITLDNLAKVMTVYSNIGLKIGGKTDNEGDALDNYRKSHKIAEITMNELIKRGITSNRLRFEGYGENYPVVSNETPEGRKLNQRISIRLTKK